MTSDPDLLAIGREIARIRAERGISQERLAECAGVHRNYVGLVERGERNPTLKTLLAITGALELSLIDMFAAAVPAKPAPNPEGAR